MGLRPPDMFILYSLIYFIFLILLLPYEFMKRPKAARKRWLKEKLGCLKIKPKAGHPIIWLHAVSVGEVIASVSFINALHEQNPNLNFIVSTVTDTGQNVASERLKGMAEIIYLPFDMGFILKRAFKNIRPILFITMETEIWPNIFKVMKNNGVPVVILNGRISSGSFKGYGMIRFFMARVLENVDLCCMQERLYAERIIALGARADRVKVTGNFKFDIRTSPQKPAWQDNIAGAVIVAGSTHRTEEDLILCQFMKLREEFSSLNLVLAPRHPERFKEVEDLIKSKGVSFIRRTEISNKSQISGAVVILDTIGELFSVYGISDITIIGGSFIGHGGQNPLEPAYWGKPVVCGPHMENFPFIEDFIRKGAIISVGEDGLYSAIKGLLSAPEKGHEIGQKAKKLCMERTGAVDRALKALEGYISRGAV